MRKRALFVGELFSEIGYDVQLTSCRCPPTTGEAWKKISGGDEFLWMGSTAAESAWAVRRPWTTTPFSFGLKLNGDKANCDGTESVWQRK